MIRTTILKDLEVKAASSTPVEAFTNDSEEIYLNVCYSGSESRELKNATALAKSPTGSIVEIAYSGASVKASAGTSFYYQL